MTGKVPGPFPAAPPASSVAERALCPPSPAAAPMPAGTPSPAPAPAIREVLILGTGAMATLVGAHLARTGLVRVAVSGTWSEALVAIERDGLIVEGPSGTWSAAVSAVPLSNVDRRYDTTFVLVKSYRTAGVAPFAALSLVDGGLAVTLQNGLGNEPALAAHVGGDNVVVGVTSLGATLVDPGRVRQAGAGPTALACRSCRPEALGNAARLLSLAGFDVTVGADVDGLVWGKLAVNCAINATSAVYRLRNGELLTEPRARDDMEAAAREVGRVAAALGIRIPGDPVAMATRVAAATADNCSSMLQDVLRGARTEIDALNGAVVREGARVGVPTPVNERLWRQVRDLGGGDE